MGITLFCYVEMHFGDRRKNWADQYTVRCGYGTELCTYLDMVGVEDIPYPYCFLEIKKISNDERIAILQKSGVHLILTTVYL